MITVSYDPLSVISTSSPLSPTTLSSKLRLDRLNAEFKLSKKYGFGSTATYFSMDVIFSRHLKFVPGPVPELWLAKDIDGFSSLSFIPPLLDLPNSITFEPRDLSNKAHRCSSSGEDLLPLLLQKLANVRNRRSSSNDRTNSPTARTPSAHAKMSVSANVTRLNQTFLVRLRNRLRWP